MLFESPIHYALCVSQKQFDAELRRLGRTPEQGVNDGAGATTNIFKAPNGRLCALVCLFDHSLDYEQIASLLAHEAVHLFQEIKKNIGERDPSAEFEAYCIQRITQNLLYAYKKQVKRKAMKK